VAVERTWALATMQRSPPHSPAAPSLAAPLGPRLSMKPGQQSSEGYAHGSDLLVDRCASYELYGDARHNKVFIQVRPL
jgi:hypothetical protein